MHDTFDVIASALFVGCGATAVMDGWSILRKRLLGIPPLDYALVGRWFAYLPRGRFVHRPIAVSPPVHGERMLGWIAHYGSGVAFAGVLLAIFGVEWLCRPTIGPALIVGIGTIVAPFLLLQPGMGAGIAARRTPRPNAARLQSLITHTVFGFGLYAAGWLARSLDALLSIDLCA